MLPPGIAPFELQLASVLTAVHTTNMEEFATVPWYPSSAEYELFRSTADDPEVFFPTFDDWLAAALEHEARATDYGILVVRIKMTVSRFESWRRSTGLRNDLEGRSLFAEMAGKKLVGSESRMHSTEK